MKKFSYVSTIIILLCAHNFIQAQLPNSLKKYIPSSTSSLSTDEAVAGIKEALEKGTERAVGFVAIEDGYFKNPEIKIPFPPEASQMEQKLRTVGMGHQVDEAILSFNRAAENAAKEIQPIFINAIKSMTVNDALEIINGPDNAATNFLQNTTSSELTIKIRPVIEKSLEEVNATRYWKDLVTAYNAIPFVKKMNPDLAEYVTEEAISGLFIMVAHEEAKIRTDPMARTTDILKKVFGD